MNVAADTRLCNAQYCNSVTRPVDLSLRAPYFAAMDGTEKDRSAVAAEQEAVLDTGKPPKAKSLGPLVMIWRQALQYPAQIVVALIALTVTATATLAIPAYFKVIIDRGFRAGRTCRGSTMHSNSWR